jgi:hypothetical protein
MEQESRCSLCGMPGIWQCNCFEKTISLMDKEMALKLLRNRFDQVDSEMHDLLEEIVKLENKKDENKS